MNSDMLSPAQQTALAHPCRSLDERRHPRYGYWYRHDRLVIALSLSIDLGDLPTTHAAGAWHATASLYQPTVDTPVDASGPGEPPPGYVAGTIRAWEGRLLRPYTLTPADQLAYDPAILVSRLLDWCLSGVGEPDTRLESRIVATCHRWVRLTADELARVQVGQPSLERNEVNGCR